VEGYRKVRGKVDREPKVCSLLLMRVLVDRRGKSGIKGVLLETSEFFLADTSLSFYLSY
jgi:hypothetical protein